MKSMLRSVHHFLVSEDGPTSVEYCVMLSFIMMVCILAITALGNQTHALFEQTYEVMP